MAYSGIEGSEEVDAKKLVEIAKVLGVTVEAIENFSEESVFNYFNTYYDTKDSVINAGNYNCTFNPLDKVVEFYERLVQVEKEKVEYIEKLYKGK